MPESLEEAALSGSLFQPRSQSVRSSSSASPPNTDDELGSDLSRPASPMASRGAPMGSVNGRPSRPQTGPKGVVEDRKQAMHTHQAETRLAQLAAAEYAEQHAITVPTITEEDQARAARVNDEAPPQTGPTEEDDVRTRRRQLRLEEMKRERDGDNFSGKRGGLKEVGKESFVQAVERPGWVVVLLYEPHIPRCQEYLSSMLELSLRLNRSATLDPPVLLLHAKATNLSFSLLPQLDGAEDDGPRRADPDVLPSLLAYKNGSLVESWIRVDLELQQDDSIEGIEGLLIREGIISNNNDASDDDE